MWNNRTTILWCQTLFSKRQTPASLRPFRIYLTTANGKYFVKVCHAKINRDHLITYLGMEDWDTNLSSFVLWLLNSAFLKKVIPTWSTTAFLKFCLLTYSWKNNLIREIAILESSRGRKLNIQYNISKCLFSH